MTEREILQEARDALELAIKAVKDHIEFAESEYGQLREWDELVKNKYSQHDPYKFHFKKIDKFQQVITNIDTALADHSPDAGNMDAGQLVEKIRGYFLDDDDAKFYMPFSVACALIEGYGRRVPGAMLRRLAIEILLASRARKTLMEIQFNAMCEDIATKYGVKIEEEV